MRLLRSIALALALLPGCSGFITEGVAELGGAAGGAGMAGGGGSGQGGAGAGGGGAEVDPCAGATLGPSTAGMRQLTPWEYRNAVATLLPGVQVPSSVRLDDVDARLTFDNLASAQGMTAGRVDQFLAAAEAVASLAVSDVNARTGCAASDGPCREGWALAFASRAFRRPLSPEEQQRYRDFVRSTTAQVGAATALEAFLGAVLQSPHFLFKPEAGLPSAAVGGAIPLDGFERATRLAFLLTGTVPDAELARAAAAGELGEPTAIEAQARRLLALPSARAAVQHFHDGWLHASLLDRFAPNTAVFPEVRAADRDSYRASYQAFVGHVFWDTPARASDYFLDDSVFLDARLASLLSQSAPAQGALERRRLADRKGVLTQPWFLAAFSHPDFTAPVLRGVHVLDRFLCKPVGAPPPGVNNSPPPSSSALPNTTRNRFAAHAADATCAACHLRIDGIGFGLEGYDALGRRRTTENGHPIDERGEVRSGTDVDGPFVGGLALADKLGASRSTEQCLASHWYEYALGAPAWQSGTCTQAALGEALRQAGGTREFLLQLVRSPAFLTRAPGEAP